MLAYIIGLTVAAVGAVQYKGYTIPTDKTGIIDRSYRFENFPKFIKNEDNFHYFCKNVYNLQNGMSRHDAENWVKNFCCKRNEKEACKKYFALEHKRQGLINATLAYYHGKAKMRKLAKSIIEDVQLVRGDKCLSIAEECYITNGMKSLILHYDRHIVKTVTENCRHRAEVKPYWKKKTCYSQLDPAEKSVYAFLRS
ncbi:unnamed protein product [Bursaphelenchus okinawaensis]|uniref:DUF19 domain-containing protein n=1 Tax=Bursaphelenchus okinawaensis TaxID=465554 RepID=A0A811JU92_9BILA|nr:unnamed protein product [Bursaphelenchus okinawaensis]CAG9084166.1 unnamed protein product [Bursaphelenchus okinawaensis]